MEGTIGPCEMCGGTQLLMPFGPNDEKICFECGMKNLPTTIIKTLEYLKRIDDSKLLFIDVVPLDEYVKQFTPNNN